MKSSITEKEYCSTICKSKCCYAYYDDIPIMPCPKLNQHNLCEIYKERYEENKPYGFVKAVSYKDKLVVINVTCGNIKDIIKNKQLPDEVIKQCCHYNPKLLEIHYED